MKIDWARFKNYGLWVSIFALIPLILNAFGVKIVPEEYTEITNAILAVLVAAGIISNPTTEAKWYLDDKQANTEDETKKE
ncbi:phage holin [Clostridium sp. D53t1_180928_C8]|uniref:phage holin n=1 Tax=Clostridium sp. D53t1_180928_C8 TaxID=2787101 RepID=UPI0018AA5F35|nr:phage holin [Clostridium sp. D53t1_180928_C8]